ncbi:type IX secretion system sortase PorU [Nibribacter ruber]|uniref:Type IX secretion system sortase PorU n=1 Tax=Nibribacter ruber TaxID=2698458 RepID=A0A6P1NVG3_9BACT|nr:type IX secretion system sortase PorU [Nibribacter ruber]QHL87707.1 type IX secretion system sortase PorU [Nibribacter ruber]
MHLFRNLLLGFCLWVFSAAAVFAQQETTRTITWRNQSVSGAAGKPGSVPPTFEEASYSQPGALPFYVFTIPGAAVSSIEFTHLEFAPLPQSFLASFPENSLKTEITPQISTGTSNRQTFSTVSFQPYRLNPQTGAAERLVSFSYRYRSGGVAAPASRKTGTAPLPLRSHVTRSVLSSGDWYKIGVPATGMYKLDRAVLQSMGVNVQNLNPRLLRLFGNGGGMLPQANSAPRVEDLTENAVWVEGQQDGTFDANDYLLFYGQGPHTWAVDASGAAPFIHSKNLFSDTTYYYLTIGPAEGKRVTARASLSGSFPVVSSFDERWHHEVDSKNMIQSGREWYGEEFNAFTQQSPFTFSASDLVPGSSVVLASGVLGSSPEASSFKVSLNGALLGEHVVQGYDAGDPYHEAGFNSNKIFAQNLSNIPSSTDLAVSYVFQPGRSSSAVGYLNYFSLFAQRQLKLFGTSTSFRSLASLQQPVTTYQIGNLPATALVWDVTNPTEPVQQLLAVGNGVAQFSANSTELREFVLFNGNSFATPAFLGKVANQNLHSLNVDGSLDLIILAPPAFLPQAQRLADYRRNRNSLQVEVVSLPQVFEEFASGQRDWTAIRDFMKMLYDRSQKQGEQQLNLLLLGDASYDPKFRIASSAQYVPIYQSRESLHPVYSYSSDDYFGLLDAHEGEWSEKNFSTQEMLDIGIGRLPAKTSAEADLLVNKILTYESDASRGNWRNRLVFLADDGEVNEHLGDAENLSRYMETNHPAYLSEKLYLDLYPQISVPNGKRSPATNKALQDAIEKGALLVNYTGHGNEVSLADEQILTINEILAWKNPDKLTFLLTATCEIGRYDDPRRNSGAETALLHPAGGAVGLLTTTRPVYSDGNRKLNSSFFQAAFTPLPSGAMPTLGYLLRYTKNNSLHQVNNRNFALLGDPSMTLAYPQLQVSATEVNGKPVSASASDTLHALSKVVLKGQVTDAQQQVVSGFQGKVHVSVYDKPSTVSTLGDQDPVRKISVKDNLLYDGVVSVQNGLFTITFVVPKDINYQVGLGSIHFYALSAATDGNGAASIPVGGADGSVTADNAIPQIQLYMNDASFVSGGTTASEAVLLAHLSDDNGINTAGAGIGHEITAILDDKASDPLVLNDFYTADIDSYQSGKVRYTLKNLAAGPHTLQLKAWDTHNNSAVARIEFIVASTEKLALDHVFNIPNPFLDKTTFHFDHNRSGQELDILIQIFTVSGTLVKTLRGTSNGSSHFSDLTWDGRDDYNGLLAKGVYIYKVNVRSKQDGSSTSKFEKLVLLK